MTESKEPTEGIPEEEPTMEPPAPEEGSAESAVVPEGESVGESTDGPVPFEPEEGRIRRLEEQLDEAKDRYLRLAAEYDNFRKRVARERIELTERAQADLLARVLDVLDDLDRLVGIDLETTTHATLHEGMVLVDRKVRKELEGAGLARIAPEGQPFDPNEHEAVSTQPTDDASVDHHVAATFQVGYRFRGTLIRPARVQVYTASSQG